MSSRTAGLAVTVTALVLSGCSASTSSGFSDSAGGEHTARFVQQPWADAVVETQIAIQVLEQLGYDASTQEVSVPLGAQALATGRADAYLANWWPSQEDVFAEYLDDGTIEVVGQVLEGTQFSPAVPGYVVSDLGVESFADLDQHADAFGRKFYGIEPGAPANDTIQKMIDQDAYGLGDWELVPSSTEAMLAQVSRLSTQKKPIAFLGWSPHWMTTEFDLHFLEDPEEVWPGAGEIRSVVRADLTEDDPNLVRFVSQISVDTETASEFIRMVDKEGMSPEEVAEQWIQDNPDQLETWLNGVESVDGEPAAQVVLGQGGK
jgi:glycine betaine/proline transport system substrate-binding protein